MEISPTNLFKFFGLLTPFLIIFFLLMSSLVNQDAKVLAYLLGTSISCFFNLFFMHLIKNPRAEDASPFCNFLTFPFTEKSTTRDMYDAPAMSSMFIAFTLSYLWLPMAFNPPNTVNLPLILSLSALLIIDIIAQNNQKCTGPLGSILGTILGLAMGGAWYGFISTTQFKNLLYYSDFTGNKTICSRPEKQYFKCDVYKNGKLLQTSNM